MGDGTEASVFQFHEGPIKTIESDDRTIRFSRFQFHEGPIKTMQLIDSSHAALMSFNSMKVRLKLDNSEKDFLRDKLFQFHEGPIKTFGKRIIM